MRRLSSTHVYVCTSCVCVCVCMYKRVCVCVCVCVCTHAQNDEPVHQHPHLEVRVHAPGPRARATWRRAHAQPRAQPPPQACVTRTISALSERQVRHARFTPRRPTSSSGVMQCCSLNTALKRHRRMSATLPTSPLLRVLPSSTVGGLLRRCSSSSGMA
jgi:hypothetical protein